MSIVQQKEKVFGNISILRTLTDDFPQLSINNSFPSITNQGNSEELLIDLILSLLGFEKLKNVLIDVLTYAAEEAESIIKESLKLELKSIVACGIDPAIPTWMNTGIDIPITEIDFFNLFKTGINGLIKIESITVGTYGSILSEARSMSERGSS